MRNRLAAILLNLLWPAALIAGDAEPKLEPIPKVSAKPKAAAEKKPEKQAEPAAAEVPPPDAVLDAARNAYASELAEARGEFRRRVLAAQAAYRKALERRLPAAREAGEQLRVKRIEAALRELEKNTVSASIMTVATKRAVRRKAKQHGGHAYAMIRVPATWREAVQHCRDIGGYLAVIEGEEENDFITGLIGQRWWQVWIGATDEAAEGQWQYIDGEKLQYANWAKDEPNNEDGAEHFAMLNGAGDWHDLDGTARLWFICEWDEVPPKGLRPDEEE